MEDKPFKFDPANPRIVNNVSRPSTVYYGAALFFLGSMQVYRRRVFRIDGNALNLALFTGASAWASYHYSAFFFSSANIEAGLLNN